MSKHTYTSLKDVLKNEGAVSPNPKFKNFSICREKPELRAFYTNMSLDKSVMQDLSSTKTSESDGIKKLFLLCLKKIKDCTMSVVFLVRRKMGA